jgi:hypothetical protein
MRTDIIRKNESNDCLPFPQYRRSLVLTVPIDILGETSSAQESDVERAVVWCVFLVKDNSNLGSYKPRIAPTNGSIAGTRNL